MKILNWVQSNLIGKQEKKKAFHAGLGSSRHSYTPDARKEEFNDWPEGFLAIGTFGNKETKNEPHPKNSCSSQKNPSDFTLEEVIKLQKELTKLLAVKPKSSTDGAEIGGRDSASLPLNRFLNCPSSLEVDRGDPTKLLDDVNDNVNGDLSPATEIILSKAKDILADNRGKINQRSLSILFKKMFVWRSGSTPSAALRDPIPESRMEKILRTILHKKIYAQSSTTSSTTKYLENKHIDNKGEDGQWVKTDSEYIVLEI